MVLTVANTGRTDRRPAREHIFERFHRGEMGENVPGHGLGLNLARELARLHGGDVRLARSENDWTEFEVRFRVRERARDSCRATATRMRVARLLRSRLPLFVRRLRGAGVHRAHERRAQLPRLRRSASAPGSAARSISNITTSTQPPPGLIDAAGDSLFNPRLSLFLDVQAGPHVYFFAQARLDRGFDPTDERRAKCGWMNTRCVSRRGRTAGSAFRSANSRPSPAIGTRAISRGTIHSSPRR